MVPIRNVKEFEELEGKVTLLLPKFKKEWMRRWFIPSRRSKYFRIHLDELGSEVWLNIDDKKNVNAICQSVSTFLNRKQQVEEHLEERVTGFLNQLYKNRFIMFRNI
jgi:hypothetical protein